MRRLTMKLTIATVAGCFALAAGAQASTLTGSIGLGDSTDSLQIGAATLSNLACSGVGCGGEISAITSPGGYAGAMITGANGGTLLTNTSSAVEDLTVSFELQSSPGNISSIGLVVGSGTGTATVSETVTDYNTNSSLAHVSGQGIGTTTTLTLANADNNIYITKDISVSPDSSLMSVTQYFYDVPGPSTSVPEPATIGIFGLGLGALFFARRIRAV
jgi:hypothetical protein